MVSNTTGHKMLTNIKSAMTTMADGAEAPEEEEEDCTGDYACRVLLGKLPALSKRGATVRPDDLVRAWSEECVPPMEATRAGVLPVWLRDFFINLL